METETLLPFQQVLSAAKLLTPNEKVRLKQELQEEQAVNNNSKNKAAFMEMLLNEPVYTETEIMVIEENKKSISKWRTKS